MLRNHFQIPAPLQAPLTLLEFRFCTFPPSSYSISRYHLALVQTFITLTQSSHYLQATV